MGLFNKGKKEVKVGGVPSLPELPKLPDFPTLEEEDNRMHKLPSFPYTSLGTKFSQSTIKDAVAGGREGYGDADEFADADKMRMMQEPLRRPTTEEMGMRPMMKTGAEPVFVRLDKFEDALKIFSEIKRKLSEINRLLEETKRLKEKEEGELQAWENEIRSMKEQIERVDKDIFSKI